MSSEREALLYKLHRDGQDRYIYFLLAAAGAAIGFALTQTADAALSWWELPLGAAAFCWAVSFYAGCQRLTLIDGYLKVNASLLRAETGRDRVAGRNGPAIAALSEGLRADLDKAQIRVVMWAKLQFGLLLIGAGLYVAWHVGQMYLRAVGHHEG